MPADTPLIHCSPWSVQWSITLKLQHSVTLKQCAVECFSEAVLTRSSLQVVQVSLFLSSSESPSKQRKQHEDHQNLRTAQHYSISFVFIMIPIFSLSHTFPCNLPNLLPLIFFFPYSHSLPPSTSISFFPYYLSLILPPSPSPLLTLLPIGTPNR